MIAAVSILLLLIAISDIKEKRIPNRLLGIFLLCTVLDGVFYKELSWVERIAGSVCVSVFLLFVNCLKSGAFGAGDVKLMGISGILLGIKKNLAALVFAVALAGIYCIIGIGIKKKERNTVIAFGPFLCAGIVLAMFWGDAFVRWYIR